MSSATTAERPATARLAQFQAAVKEAEDRVREVETERRRAMGELRKVEAPLRAYWEEVGAGEREPDPALEAKLAADVRDARSTAVMRPTVAANNSAQVTGVEMVDQAIEAKLAGAMRALGERRRELTAFLTRNRELVSEWTVEAERVRATCQERWSALSEALRDWQSLTVRWGPFCEANGIGRGELPPHPLVGLDRDPGRHGIELPMPRSLIPDPDPEP